MAFTLEIPLIIIHSFFIHSTDQANSIDEQSGSIFKLNNGIILYLRQINKFMALVCILREYNFTRKGIIEYNFLCLHDAIHKLFAVRLPRKVGKFSISTQDDDSDDDTNGNYVNGNAGHGQTYDKIH